MESTRKQVRQAIGIPFSDALARDLYKFNMDF